MKKRIMKKGFGILLALAMILSLLPVSGMKAYAMSGNEYKVLFWAPAINEEDGHLEAADIAIDLYTNMNLDGKTVSVEKQLPTDAENPIHFSGTEKLADTYDLVWVYMPMVELNDNDIKVLSDYVKAGGRIVMQAEWNSWSENANGILSRAAQALGTSFTITSNDVKEGDELELNLSSDLLDGKALKGAGTPAFDCFADIEYQKPAEVIASYQGATAIVDQAVEKGRITVLSDTNLYTEFLSDSMYGVEFCVYNEATDNWDVKKEITKEEVQAYGQAVEDLLGRFLTNSKENMDLVKEGGNPNAGFGGLPAEPSEPILPDPSVPTTPTPEPTDHGKVENNTNTKDNAFSSNLNETAEELKDKVLTVAERERVANGESARIYLEVSDISSQVSDTDKTLVENAKGNATVGMYLDINLFKQIGSDVAQKVPNTNGTVTITVKVPENLINKDGSLVRTYQIVRVHDGVPTVIDCIYDAEAGTISFETDAFSTYALVYMDSAANQISASPKTGDNSPIAIFLGIMLMSVVGAAYFGRRKTI